VTIPLEFKKVVELPVIAIKKGVKGLRIAGDRARIDFREEE